MILHYLGLDHVGHYQGPKSSLLVPKLKEMDQIIEKIYNHIKIQDEKRCNSIKNQNCGTLFIVTGDHGMNELGNHGGSSPLEINTGLLFIDHSLQSNKTTHVKMNPSIVNQVDLIPSLSLLFGLPIPKNNLGKIIPNVFIKHSSEEILHALYINSKQLMNVIQGHKQFWMDGVPQSSEIYKLWEEHQNLENHVKSLYAPHFNTIEREETAKTLIIRYEKLLDNISNQFLQLLTEYDNTKLLIGVFLLFLSCIILFYILCSKIKSDINQFIFSPFYMVEIILYFGCFIVYYSSLFTSSFIEEEHQTWYFLLSTCFFVYLFLSVVVPEIANSKRIFFQCISLLIIQRFMRSWNQTGDKWIHLPDIGDFIETIPLLLILLCLISITIVLFISFIFIQFAKSWNSIYKIFVCFSTCYCCFIIFFIKIDHIDSSYLKFICTHESMNILIQISYLLLFVQLFFIFIMYYFNFYINNAKIFMFYARLPIFLLLMILHKPRNQFLLIIMIIHSFILQDFFSSLRSCFIKDNKKYCISHTIRILIITLWMSKASYFILGNSNNLASIDIGGAYTGL